MKTLLLNVEYIDNSGNYWSESYIKNQIVTQLEGENVHDTVKRVLIETDCIEFSYNGKPQSPVYVDTKNGDTKQVGWIYRVKQEIQVGNSWQIGRFDAWVTINIVQPYNFN